jgi:hypothetical protein
MSESKLDVARRKGDLTAAIGAMREEGATNAGAIAADMDATYATVANPAVVTVGMLRDLGANDLGAGQGKSVTVDNRPTEDSPELVNARKSGSLERVLRARREQVPVAKTQLSRAEKMAKTIAWAESKTEEWREQFIVSDAFEALTDRQQERISEAFSEIADNAYSDSIGIADYDFDAETPDVDAIVGDEDDGEAIDAAGLGEDDYAAIFDDAGWEAEQTS